MQNNIAVLYCVLWYLIGSVGGIVMWYKIHPSTVKADSYFFMFTLGGIGGMATFLILLKIWLEQLFISRNKKRLYAVFMRVDVGIKDDGLMAVCTSLEKAKILMGTNAYTITSFDTDTEYPNGVKYHVVNKLLDK